MTKPTKWQADLLAWASAQSDQSLCCAQLVAKDPNFLPADSEDSDQTGRMPMLILMNTVIICNFFSIYLTLINLDN